MPDFTQEDRDRAARYLGAITEQNRDYVANLRGIADGAKADPIDIAALNVRYEILYDQFGVNADDNGLERFLTATRRQNFLIPPRRHRAFPLVELA